MSPFHGQAWINSEAATPRLVPAEELERRLLNELADRVRLGGFAYPLLMSAVGLQTTVPRDYFWQYWVGFVALLAGAIWRAIAANRGRKAVLSWRESRDEIRVASLLLASVWSLLSAFGLFAYAHNDFSVFLLFGLMGWASVGATLFAPDLHLAQTFIHLNMVPAMVWCFAVREQFGWVTAVLFAVTWFFLHFFSKWSYVHLSRMIEVQIQLEDQAVALRLAKDQAEEAARARTQFLANMSHEIRTPLNGVLGVAELMGESKLDDDQRELVEIMRQSGSHLLALVNDLLDLSKMNAGKLTLERVEFDIRRMMEEMSRPMQIAAETKGLAWHFNVRKEVPQYCIGDPVRVRQVLTNLMGNALKFTERGGITVDVGMVDGKQMRFVVEDTGIGIETEKLNSIFEEFEQADHSTTRRFGGSGLGLAISRRLVEVMGGRMGVESAVGQGSMFWFELGVSPLTSESR
jgi:signal transduction histidine kinase